MINSNLKKSFKVVNAFILAIGMFSCSSNPFSTLPISNQKIQNNSKVSFNNFKKSFTIKYGSEFNAQAYFLAWADVRLSIKNKTIPDVFYHYTYAQTSDPSRVTDSNYLQIKSRIESGEWSEEAYLIANPDIKAAIEAGTEQSGYNHWYNYAINAEPTRKSKQEYLDAKSAIDAGFSEKAYRLRWSDIDSDIKAGALASAYVHWNSYAKINEPSRLSDPDYIKIKNALDKGYDEKAYLLAYPDIQSAVNAGTFPNGLRHYIDQGFSENRLEESIYQDAKLSLLFDFNAQAYFLAWADVRLSIKNKTIPDVFYHYSYTKVSETSRVTDSNYLQIKSRIESEEWSEEAYLIANPDIKAAIEAGTEQSGYNHWYNYAINAEPTRKSKQEYLDAKSAIDAGFSEKAYRLRWSDIDSNIKAGALASAYVHWNSYAKISEPSRLSDPDYIKIKNALDKGYDEKAYLLAYPDIQSAVTAGTFPNGLRHYIDQGFSENRLEREIYQDAKLAIVNDFDEQRYRTAYPDVVNGINLFWFPSAFEHFRRYGRYEGRLQRQVYLDTKSIEFRVNTLTSNNQQKSKLATDSNGNFVVVWESGAQDGDSYGIYAQRYNSSGVAQGSEFRVNTYTSNAQKNSSVAMDSAGNFVVTWQSRDQDGSFYGIYAQRYNSSGVAQGSEFRVNTYTTGSQFKPAVAMDSTGNFVVTWSSSSQEDIYYGVQAQRYNSSGIAQGAEFTVNTYITGVQVYSAIAMDSMGNFAITWQSNTQDGSSYGIYAQRYNSSGVTQGSEFRVNTFTTSSQTLPAIAMDSMGNFAITWQSNTQDGSSDGVYCQAYNADGSKPAVNGNEFLVNKYTSQAQKAPSISMNNSGEFFITWQSANQDGSSDGIYAKKYNSLRSVEKDDFQVNTFTAGLQTSPSIIMDANGNFVITWQSNDQDDSIYGIYAKRYNS